MPDGGFDVLVIAFAPRAHETAGGALARVVGMALARAEELSRALPCVVLSDVGYVHAESVVASLSLAGAEASVRPHVSAAPPLEEAGRMTMPEIAGGAAPQPARGLGAGREGSVRPAAAPSTLRPPNVSDAEPAMVFESSARVQAAALLRDRDVGQPPEGPVRPGMETVRQVPSLPRAAPLPATEGAQGFAADFGKGLELELVSVPRTRSADNRQPPGEVPEEPPLLAELPRPSLDFQLSFPREPAPEPVPLPARAPLDATERAVPRVVPMAASHPASVSPSAAPVARRAPVPRPTLEADGTITRRTLYLLAMLWLSVGLLLWTHDLL